MTSNDTRCPRHADLIPEPGTSYHLHCPQCQADIDEAIKLQEEIIEAMPFRDIALIRKVRELVCG